MEPEEYEHLEIQLVEALLDIHDSNLESPITYAQVPQVDPGQPQRLLRCVTPSLAAALVAELAEHAEQLEALGWEVETVLAPEVKAPTASKPRHEHITFAREVTWPRVMANPGTTLFFIGNVPVPYSGHSYRLDGHVQTIGAYQTWAYYVTPSTGWTDTQDNNHIINNSPIRKNVAGDGKFDQQYLFPERPLGYVGYFVPRFYTDKWKLVGETRPQMEIRMAREYLQAVIDHRKGLSRPVKHFLTGDTSGVSRPESINALNAMILKMPEVVARNKQALAASRPAAFGTEWKTEPTLPAYWVEMPVSPGRSGIHAAYESYEIDGDCKKRIGPPMKFALAGILPMNELPLNARQMTYGQILWHGWMRTNVPQNSAPYSRQFTYGTLCGDPTLTFPPE